MVESYTAAAELCPKVLGKDVKAWEDWVFAFVQKQQLPVSALGLNCGLADVFVGHHPAPAYQVATAREIDL